MKAGKIVLTVRNLPYSFVDNGYLRVVTGKPLNKLKLQIPLRPGLDLRQAAEKLGTTPKVLGNYGITAKGLDLVKCKNSLDKYGIPGWVKLRAGELATAKMIILTLARRFGAEKFVHEAADVLAIMKSPRLDEISKKSLLFSAVNNLKSSKEKAKLIVKAAGAFTVQPEKYFRFIIAVSEMYLAVSGEPKEAFFEELQAALPPKWEDWKPVFRELWGEIAWPEELGTNEGKETPALKSFFDKVLTYFVGAEDKLTYVNFVGQRTEANDFKGLMVETFIALADISEEEKIELLVLGIKIMFHDNIDEWLDIVKEAAAAIYPGDQIARNNFIKLAIGELKKGVN